MDNAPVALVRGHYMIYCLVTAFNLPMQSVTLGVNILVVALMIKSIMKKQYT